MKLNFRQGIVRSQFDASGSSSFAKKNGSDDRFIDLWCDQGPVTFTIAHFSANYLFQENKSIPRAWGPMEPTGRSQYLYWDVNLSNGEITRGFTLITPFTGPNEPNQLYPDMHWFDTSVNCMKVWNGTKWLPKLRVFAGVYSANATFIPKSTGESQIGVVGDFVAGNIMLGHNRYPLRDSDGTFITTESNLSTIASTGSNVKFEALQLYAEADEFIPKYSWVTLSSPGKISLASIESTVTVNGLVIRDCMPGEITDIVSNGLVTNDQWNFTEINAPIYLSTNGTFSLTAPQSAGKFYLGFIYDKNSIYVDIQLYFGNSADVLQTIVGHNGISVVDNGINNVISIKPTGVTADIYGNNLNIPVLEINERGQIISATSTPIDISGLSVNINLDGDIIATGNSTSIINTSLSTTGVTEGTYNTVQVDTKGRVISANNVDYLTNLIITGDVTGSGNSTLNVSLSNTGVTAGTYNTVEVDSKGRVINASNVNYLIQNDSIIISGDASGSGTNNINLTLTDTGVTAGTYNTVQVDSKGRVINANNINYLLHNEIINVSGDVAGSGNSNLTLTLSNTGVTAGTYNTVQVDTKGRVVNANNTNYLTSNENISIIGDASGSGTNNINLTLTDTGVTAGTYNTVQVDSKGRVINASTANYLLHNENIVINGDVVGSGTNNIILSLAMTGVTAGTYNTVQVDTKGRVINASNIDYLTSLSISGDVVGTGTSDINLTLTDTGVTAGTYNTVQVDTKGRVVNANNIDYLTSNENIIISGDASGSGTNNINLTLTDTGVTAGTYNSVQVDSKGRVINASNVTYTNSLSALSDVNLTTPTTGEVLIYNGTKWTSNISADFKNNFVTNAKLVNYSEKVNFATIQSGILTLDISLGNSFVITMTENITSMSIINSNNWNSNTLYGITIFVIQNDTIAKTLTWPANLKWDSKFPLTISSTLSSLDVFNLISFNSGTFWLCFPAGQDMG